MRFENPHSRRPPLRAVAALALLACGASLAAPDRTGVRFEGLVEIPEAEARKMIEAQLDWISQHGASEALADDAAYFLERAMRGRGFPDAEVVPRLKSGSRALTLVVDEGARRRLGTVSFSGNAAEIPEGELKALLTRATVNRSRGVALRGKSLPFVRRDIEAGLSDIAASYRALGYLDAQASSPQTGARPPGADTVDVEVRIAAGERYRIGALDLEGLDEEEKAGLRDALAEYVDQVATTGNVAAARSLVADRVRQAGHYKSEIEVTSTRRAEGVIDLRFGVRKGRRFDVASTVIEGNEEVGEAFLRRRFAGLEGRPYDAAEVEAIHRELLSTGMFESISIRPEERAGNLVDLLVTVDEARTRELAVVGGYGTFEGGIVGATMHERNLFGTGRQLRAQAELTGRGLAGDIKYTDRWFFETPLRFEASLFGIRKELEGYRKFETGLRGEVLWPVGEHFSAGAFAQIGMVDIYESEIDAAFLGDRTYRLSTIGFSASYDTRDDPLSPRTGMLAGTTLEYASAALGSEVDFLRGSLKLTRHFPVGEQGELRLGARSGFIMPTGDSDEIPIDLRFFSGGSTSVRSFEERHLGPDDGRGHPVGGEFYTTFNAEYSFPLAGILRGATFIDAGNLLGDLDDAGFSDMRYAAGLGLRLDLPTGPVRVDYGWNLDRGDGEPSGAFHVSIGLAF